jgi:Fis family transcriptional regulator, factor for inversion stimulation protein
MQDRFDGMVTQLLDAGFFLEQAIEIVEKGMIQGALERSSGNQCAAARQLGIHRNTLQRKLSQYQIAPTGRLRRKPAIASAALKRKKSRVA